MREKGDICTVKEIVLSFVLLLSYKFFLLESQCVAWIVLFIMCLIQ